MKVPCQRNPWLVFSTTIALCGAFSTATAATLTWNKNLSDDDTAYYSMYDDDNWIVEGEHAGTAPTGFTEGIYTGDDVIIPNGITARWEDPGTGTGKTRQGRSLTVGNADPGITRVLFKNNYSSGSAELRFNSGMTGDPDNNLAAGEWHIQGSGGRGLIIKGTQSYSFLHQFGCANYFEFYGTDIKGVCGSGNTSQIRTSGTPDIIAPDRWVGPLQFRDFKGTFTATNTFVCGGLDWRGSTRCAVMLGSYDHVIDSFTFNGFSGSDQAGIQMTGGSITMKTWKDNQFTGPANFKLDTATLNLFGGANDTKILMAARGRDDGPTGSGFTDNFAIGTLVVGDDAGDIVTVQSPSGPYAEGIASADAALYVGAIDLSSGAGLVIPEGAKIYTRQIIGSRSNVTGSERLIILPGTVLMFF